MHRLRILTLVCIVIASSIYVFNNSKKSTLPYVEEETTHKSWLLKNSNPITAVEDTRAPDQTFLTYPEWFLVHSPAEQANYFKNHTATTFPYMTHIDQIWDSYAIVSHTIENNFEYNSDYHLMIKVIGVSASAEYALKAWYENIIGRVTDTSDSEPLTQEDRFNYRFTQDYVDFIRTTPWYDFDFQSRLVQLWSETNFFGPNFLRKLERKYILTSELLVKIAYAKLIKLGTQTMYEEALLTTVVLVNTLPEEINTNSIKVLSRLNNGTVLLRVPRYAAFNPTVVGLAKKGISFLEIAGNNSAILLTLLVNSTYNFNIDNTQILFEQPIPSQASKKRVAVITTVPALSQTLLKIVDENLTIEHVYDY
ncbi:MAG: hypothetical protein WBF77_05770 [Sulfurimonadaceae bacterium]